MEAGGSYNQTDAEGFLRIQGLPARDVSRAALQLRDAPEPELGPAKLWEAEEKGKGAKKTVYLRLESEANDGESGDHGAVDGGYRVARRRQSLICRSA